MSGFAALQPSLTLRLTFDVPVVIGETNSGNQLFTALINSGTLTSEPGFSPAVDGSVVFGTDHFRVTKDNKYCTIDVKAVIKNSDGAAISCAYTGHIDITPDLAAIMSGSRAVKTIDFGNVFTHIIFETGTENFKPLETGRFVGTSRFIIEAEKPPVIEMKISKVVKG